MWPNTPLVGIFIVLLSLIYSCTNKNMLVLTKIQLDSASVVDTVESNPRTGLSLVYITKYRAFGKFENYPAIIKMSKLGKIVYRINDRGNYIRISKDYIALTEPIDRINEGWFKIVDGKIYPGLPHVNDIIDSLRRIYTKEHVINETNGDIRILLNGKIVERLNYGNIVMKDKGLKFEYLDYKLYKLDGDSLIAVSNNSNDIFKQRDGVYFVPSPGYGVIEKFNKQEILKAVDSATQLQPLPNILKFKSVLL